MSQGQRSRSKCQKLRIISSIIVTDIPIKPQQWFLSCTLPLFRLRDLDLGAMTLKLNRDLYILKMYFQMKMKLLGQAIRKVLPELEKYENSFQG